MLSQSITNEDLLLTYVLGGEEMMTKLEKECQTFVINLLVTHSSNSTRSARWDKDCEFAFWDFVRNDSYWSEQSTEVQKRFVCMSVTKVSIYIELYFDQLMS